MKVRLVRKGWKVNKDNFNIIVKPSQKRAFDFWLNVRSAAYFACNELGGVTIPHDLIMLEKPGPFEPFNRKMLRIK